MFDYNDVMKNYMKREPEEPNYVEKKHKKKKISAKKMEKMYSERIKVGLLFFAAPWY